MSPRKLTEEDKQEILSLYRETEETTSTLASRYDVSSSTISRFLKNSLSESEYEELIQQKRLGRTASRTSKTTIPEEKATLKPVPQKPQIQTPVKSVPSPVKESIEEEEDLSDEEDQEMEEAEISALGEMFGEDVYDLDDDEDLEEDDWEEDIPETPSKVPSKRTAIQVLPLSQASLPRVCYLVIDRAAELITRPLKEFGDLGTIPAEEVQQQTLPVFENHKVARRFSNRSQRVIKVPDSQMLKKAGAYLEAKGITRLLIDGQVYRVIGEVEG